MSKVDAIAKPAETKPYDELRNRWRRARRLFFDIVTRIETGASLVIVGSGSSTVNIFDPSTTPGGLGVTFFSTTLSYTQTLFGAPSGGPVLFDTFGADGQVGRSRTDTASVTGETTYINNSPISGPGIGAPNSDSDWNGNSGAPLPQLWDDHGHDISEVSLGSPPALRVSIKSFGDCLTTVANVVQF